MYIKIYNSNIQQGKKIKKQLEKKIQRDGLEIFVEFYNNNESLEYLSDTSVIYIFFVEKNNDFAIKKIRNLKNTDNSYILIITDESKFIFETYDLNIYSYLKLDNINLETQIISVVNKIIETLLNKMKKTKYTLTHFVKFKECTKLLSEYDIMFINSNLHNLNFSILENKLIIKYTLCNKKLDEIEKKVNEEIFLRINKSFLVNMNFIKNIKNKEIELENGQFLNCSRNYYKKALEKYKIFSKRQLTYLGK